MALAAVAAAGGTYLQSRVPEMLAAAGVADPRAAAELAEAELDKLLALRPAG